METNRIIELTNDGSHTILIPALNITYHSKHGALQESIHIFIKEGLQHLLQNLPQKINVINIFEVGFGTGLNTLLTFQKAIKDNQKILYTTVEPHPISVEAAETLNYVSLINNNLKNCYLQLHTSEWNKEIEIDSLFHFIKLKMELQQFTSQKKFHLIYFDAFDPNAQPELWTIDIFKKLYNLLYDNGILITYSSKGMVRRNLQSAGFIVEKIAGPPGKREIVRAIKTNAVNQY